jgi:hypothetical protein
VPENSQAEELQSQRPPSTQPHYTCAQLAKMWKFHQSTILRIFKNEPGVLRLGNVRAKKRVKISLRIPQEVADRVWSRLTGQTAA